MDVHPLAIHGLLLIDCLPAKDDFPVDGPEESCTAQEEARKAGDPNLYRDAMHVGVLDRRSVQRLLHHLERDLGNFPDSIGHDHDANDSFLRAPHPQALKVNRILGH